MYINVAVTEVRNVIFFQVHKWVNVESMLEKCFVGKLVVDTKGEYRRGSFKYVLIPYFRQKYFQQIRS